ncbi:hypothetical protein CO054_00560 [Candidatus Shapirobacteria bacterium CG_4_9_14_0_2_um_filter_39_11]|uniref:Uncharacterized protein n=1 Tax=Candidatus Shapirobacteria bacterium CG_4_9_14_0_2_um_filter_39_11 TaxID=1974478 RepID=A0A2M8ETA8_9BACT|nr:MAG: hypothetical protein CO054_00560 [Candidatus Shapirobacteria bacterium CG_4_9_14_0_2_um_filter_39_11]
MPNLPEKKKKKISVSLILSLSISLGLFFFLIAFVIFFNLTNVRYLQYLRGEKGEINPPEGALIPSQILNNKPKYTQQRIIVRGRVSPEPAVCEKKECPTNDPCCGCPSERDLLISDSEAVLTSKTKGVLRLLDPNGKSLCQRQKFSCEYSCQDWVKEAIYDVGGTFYAEPPPPGWKLSLEYYFKVESKNLVKTTSLGESARNVFNDIKEMFKQLTTSGSYVLP